METPKLAKPHVYVHAGTYKQFTDYQQQNVDYQCNLLHDGTSIRGRTPGQIVRIGTFRDKWNDQEIEESIAIYEEEWNRQSNPSTQQEGDDNTIMDYGV